MRMLAYILVGFIFTACGPTHKNIALNTEKAQHIHTLAVQLKSKGEFQVVMDRATATAGPAVMFGLIGAVVASAYNNSKDVDRRKQLDPYMAGFDHEKIVRLALIDGLNRQSRFSVIEAKNRDALKQSGADGELKIQIQSWGLKTVDQRSETLVKPFVKIKTIIQTVSNHKNIMDVNNTYFSSDSKNFSDYANDGDLLKAELEQVLIKAGKQIAARIVYTMGGS